MSLDQFLERPYVQYSCWVFIQDVWKHLKHEDIGDMTPISPGVGSCIDAVGPAKKHFQKITLPEEPCIVLMETPGSVPHVGIYTKRKVIHMVKPAPRYVTLQSLQKEYKKVTYYKPCQK